ncbi:L-threonylcarbamoyladenylate synthase [Bacteroidia bacterium]|nr:L-threonylcarbamoyladenylate synthase [Bacteroidia bacterium]MDC1395677.1 L-threonylcarbamoyladenylate synthase [Bacteroidia bacterium]
MIGTDVSKASKLLTQGELVAIPTETVYGLAANALDATAVAKIYTAKQRPSFNPLIVHVSDTDQVLNYVSDFSLLAQQLAKAFWPGSLTILMPKNDKVPDLVTAGLPNVALRVPNHPLTLQLLKSLAFPLAAPSANVSNTVSPTTAHRVEQNLGNVVHYILDGGKCDVGVESTIVSVIDNQITLLREGGISKEQIEEELGIEISTKAEEKIMAPGQLKKHYATRKPLFLVDDIQDALLRHQAEKVSVLLFESIPTTENYIPYLLSSDYDLSEIANNLFEMMHFADEDDGEFILAARCKNEGIGRAINDRLTRASVR